MLRSRSGSAGKKKAPSSASFSPGSQRFQNGALRPGGINRPTLSPSIRPGRRSIRAFVFCNSFDWTEPLIQNFSPPLFSEATPATQRPDARRSADFPYPILRRTGLRRFVFFPNQKAAVSKRFDPDFFATDPKPFREDDVLLVAHIHHLGNGAFGCCVFAPPDFFRLRLRCLPVSKRHKLQPAALVAEDAIMNQSEVGRKEKPPKAVISGFKRFSPICRRQVVAETGIEPVRQRLRILSPLRLPISSLGDSVHNYGRGRHFSEKLSVAGKPFRLGSITGGSYCLLLSPYCRKSP